VQNKNDGNNTYFDSEQFRWDLKTYLFAGYWKRWRISDVM